MNVDHARPLRLFFALWPPTALRDAMANVARAHLLGSSYRRIPVENYHLTLQFLGSIAVNRVDSLRAIGRLQQSSPFELVLQRVEHWPSGIAALVPDLMPSGLTDLVMSLRAGLKVAGFSLETRDFHAHVTLAREVSESPLALECKLPTWTVHEFSLVASNPTSAGSAYCTLETWSLG